MQREGTAPGQGRGDPRSPEPQQTYMGGQWRHQHCRDQKLPAMGLRSLQVSVGREARLHEASPRERDKPMAGPEKETEMARINAPSVLSISFRLSGASPQLMQEAPELVPDPAGPGTGNK